MDENRRKSRLAPAMFVACILLAIVAVYVRGYLNGKNVVTATGERLHSYSAKWQCMIYLPAARAESLLCGVPIHLCYSTGPHEYTAYE
jgi:hypothetical protein